MQLKNSFWILEDQLKGLFSFLLIYNMKIIKINKKKKKKNKGK